MKLSVIIPVSRDIRINKCLSSISNNVEVIVVLNDPSEEVKGIVYKWKKKKRLLKVFEIAEKNVSKARNFGVKKARYENVLFMDSDCVFDKKCLEIIDSRLKKYGIVHGVVMNGDKPRSRVEGDWFTPNLGIRKKVFSKLGGFDEGVRYTEDYDLSIRINESGFSKVFEPRAVVHHPKLRFWTEYARMWFTYGIGYSQIDRKYDNSFCLKRAVSIMGIRKLIKRESFRKKSARIFMGPVRLLGYAYERLKFKIS
ncbi:MAG: glycosyltransferase [archaeon]